MESSNFPFAATTSGVGNTVTVGNVAYRVVKAETSATMSSQNAAANNSSANGIQVS
jgi:hypothetical protein